MNLRSTLGIGFAAGLLAAGPASAGIGYENELLPADDALAVEVWIEDESDYYDDHDFVEIGFRPSEDSYVVIYGVDTDGMLHLVYPVDDSDRRYFQGGSEYYVESPLLDAGKGLDGVAYVQALACSYPLDPYFPTWFGVDRNHRVRPGAHHRERDLVVRLGVVIGDPYLGLADLRASLLPRHCAPRHVAFGTVYYSVRAPRHYPRYLCADCHVGGWYDPYRDHCNVFDVRIDAWWTDALYPRRCQPRFTYWKRSDAPHRYRSYKSTWSTKDRWTDDRGDHLVRNFGGKAPRERDHLVARKDHRPDRPGRTTIKDARPTRSRGERDIDRSRTARDDRTRVKNGRDRGDRGRQKVDRPRSDRGSDRKKRAADKPRRDRSTRDNGKADRSRGDRGKSRNRR